MCCHRDIEKTFYYIISTILLINIDKQYLLITYLYWTTLVTVTFVSMVNMVSMEKLYSTFQLVLFNLEHVIIIITDTQSDQCGKEDIDFGMTESTASKKTGKT